MLNLLQLCSGVPVLFRSRQHIVMENLVSRQQLAVPKRRHPRPKLNSSDRLFWLVIRRCWSGWKQALLVVTPETVVRWHRAGFRWYWKLISKVRRVNANRGWRPVQFAYGIRRSQGNNAIKTFFGTDEILARHRLQMPGYFAVRWA